MERGDFLGQRVGGRVRQVGLDPRVPELKPGNFLGGAIGGVARSGGVPARAQGACPGLGGVAVGATRWCSADWRKPSVKRPQRAVGLPSRRARRLLGGCGARGSAMATAGARGNLPGWVSVLTWGLALWCLCGAGPLWR